MPKTYKEFKEMEIIK